MISQTPEQRWLYYARQKCQLDAEASLQNAREDRLQEALPTEPDATAGEQAGVSGNLKVHTVLRPAGIVATTIRCRRRAIPVQRDAGATGARNDMLAVVQLHEFRVQLSKRVACRDRHQIETLTTARAATPTVLSGQPLFPPFARLFIGTNLRRNFSR